MSFQNFFDEDLLLSSTLKPKNTSILNPKDLSGPKYWKAEEKEIPTVPTENDTVEHESKRICYRPPELVRNSSSSTPPAPTIQPFSFNLSSTADQILQIRIKLQIYQKEYAHFVESANRSSVQIQETLEELQKLISFNTDAESPRTSAKIDEFSGHKMPVQAQVDSKSTDSEVAILSVKHRSRVFSRKPRSLIFSSNESSFSDLMITSSLDGSVQLWSKNDKKINSNIYIPSHLGKPYFVEDMCWDRKGTGILAMALCESANSPAIDDVNTGRSDKQLAFLKFDPSHRADFEPKFIPIRDCPHERSISVVESWTSTKLSSDASHFLTAGLDKTIFSWKVSDLSEDQVPDITVQEIHKRHTSSIHAILHDSNRNSIWSGGADCRLIQWCGETNRLVNEAKWENRISHILNSGANPHLLLISSMAMNSQLRIYDTRNNSVVNCFGSCESANMSRYVRPSWHINGNLVANGSYSSNDSLGSINIWDIRMLGENSKALKTINCDDRRLIRTEFTPDGRSLVGMSTDASISFVELSIL